MFIENLVFSIFVEIISVSIFVERISVLFICRKAQRFISSCKVGNRGSDKLIKISNQSKNKKFNEEVVKYRFS